MKTDVKLCDPWCSLGTVQWERRPPDALSHILNHGPGLSLHNVPVRFSYNNVWKYSPAERVNIQTHQLKTDADTDIIIHKNPWAVEKIILTVMFAHSFKLQIYSWDTVANWHLISMTKFRLSSGLLKRLSPSQNDVQRKHLP